MFEDIEILHLDAPNTTMFALAIVNLGLIVWLKHGFPREWRLAGWAFLNVRRIWQRSADEAPRTVLGVLIVFVRLFTVGVLSRFKKLELVIKESTDIDRHLRTWMAASVSVIAILLSLLSPLNTDVGCNLLLSTWLFWSFFRIWRVFQTSINRISRYSFAFVYLCSLEILPTLFIILVVIDSLS